MEQGTEEVPGAVLGVQGRAPVGFLLLKPLKSGRCLSPGQGLSSPQCPWIPPQKGQRKPGEPKIHRPKIHPQGRKESRTKQQSPSPGFSDKLGLGDTGSKFDSFLPPPPGGIYFELFNINRVKTGLR